MSTAIDDALASLQTLLDPDRAANTLYRSAPHQSHIVALQQLLYYLGHGETLKWQRYGADGDYGAATTAAVQAAGAERELFSNGEQVNHPLLLLLLGDAARDRLSTLGSNPATTLYRGSPHPGEIRALQILLYQQGLGKELDWLRFGADGGYGHATARAVQSFATHRGLSSNGQRVSADILAALLDNQNPIPDHPRRTLQPLLEQGQTEVILRRGSTAQAAVKALQTLLHQLGYGEELQWQRYAADGDYGLATTNAVATAATDLGLHSDGAWLSTELLRRLLEQDAVCTSLRTLLERHEVTNSLFRGSPNGDAVRAMQIRLHGLGYGQELQWQRYGADGDYGAATTSAVSRFATDHALSGDPEHPGTELLEQLLTVRSRPQPASTETVLDIRSAGSRVQVSDGHLQHDFQRFKQGLYTVGNQPPLRFIQNSQNLLANLGLSDSLINVMVSVAENEGNLDAVNTWDNAFLSFGMLQWTAGTGNARGELAALLARLRRQEPRVFHHHFGEIGLTITGLQGNYGYLGLGGQTLDDSTAKTVLRQPDWAFRFWRAGQDAAVQAVQVAHAAARLDTFYRHTSYRVEGHYIADLVKSEYGVALLFDQHVNRPGYVTGSLASALRQSNLGDPSHWSTHQEQQLLEAYLRVRVNFGRYPMTHAEKRAAVTRRYLEQGIISAQRGSFQAPIG